jgi:hypothetical protein
MLSKIRKKVFAPLPSAIIAALGYGSWTYWVQQSPQSLTAFSAAIIQAGFAFTSTLLLGSLALYCVKHLKSSQLSFFVCSLMLCTIPSLLHVVNQTEHILFAILPGLLIGHLYLVSLLIAVKNDHLK